MASVSNDPSRQCPTGDAAAATAAVRAAPPCVALIDAAAAAIADAAEVPADEDVGVVSEPRPYLALLRPPLAVSGARAVFTRRLRTDASSSPARQRRGSPG